jgi:arylsulfatase A-like enzyme
MIRQRCCGGEKLAGKKIEDAGPLTTKRMETCDDEFVLATKDFIKRQHEDGKPFFVWFNTAHMHLHTHTKASSRGQAGRWQSPYHDTMIDHDKNVGLLDEIGLPKIPSSCIPLITGRTGTN